MGTVYLSTHEQLFFINLVTKNQQKEEPAKDSHAVYSARTLVASTAFTE